MGLALLGGQSRLLQRRWQRRPWQAATRSNRAERSQTGQVHLHPSLAEGNRLIQARLLRPMMARERMDKHRQKLDTHAQG